MSVHNSMDYRLRADCTYLTVCVFTLCVVIFTAFTVGNMYIPGDESNDDGYSYITGYAVVLEPSENTDDVKERIVDGNVGFMNLKPSIENPDDQLIKRK